MRKTSEFLFSKVSLQILWAFIGYMKLEGFFSTKIRSFKLWKMPQLLNISFLEK